MTHFPLRTGKSSSHGPVHQHRSMVEMRNGCREKAGDSVLSKSFSSLGW